MMNIERMPAARAASRPAWLSSKTRQSAGATPSARGALQEAVGIGLGGAHGVAADARARRDAVGDAELAEEAVDHGARARGDDAEPEAASRLRGSPSGAPGTGVTSAAISVQ